MKNLFNVIILVKSTINIMPELIQNNYYLYFFGLYFEITKWNQKGENKGNNFAIYKDSINLFKYTISWYTKDSYRYLDYNPFEKRFKKYCSNKK